MIPSEDYQRMGSQMIMNHEHEVCNNFRVPKTVIDRYYFNPLITVD